MLLGLFHLRTCAADTDPCWLDFDLAFADFWARNIILDLYVLDAVEPSGFHGLAAIPRFKDGIHVCEKIRR